MAIIIDVSPLKFPSPLKRRKLGSWEVKNLSRGGGASRLFSIAPLGAQLLLIFCSSSLLSIQGKPCRTDGASVHVLKIVSERIEKK
jgi:hypothetical protein